MVLAVAAAAASPLHLQAASPSGLLATPLQRLLLLLLLLLLGLVMIAVLVDVIIQFVKMMVNVKLMKMDMLFVIV